MIKKIIAIKNVGKFRAYSAKNDMEFRKLTLIYAENSCGKTTLADIFRSLQSGDPHLINGRATLGSPQPPEVIIRLDGLSPPASRPPRPRRGGQSHSSRRG